MLLNFTKGRGEDSLRKEGVHKILPGFCKEWIEMVDFRRMVVHVPIADLKKDGGCEGVMEPLMAMVATASFKTGQEEKPERHLYLAASNFSREFTKLTGPTLRVSARTTSRVGQVYKIQVTARLYNPKSSECPLVALWSGTIYHQDLVPNPRSQRPRKRTSSCPAILEKLPLGCFKNFYFERIVNGALVLERSKHRYLAVPEGFIDRESLVTSGEGDDEDWDQSAFDKFFEESPVKAKKSATMDLESAELERKKKPNDDLELIELWTQKKTSEVTKGKNQNIESTRTPNRKDGKLLETSRVDSPDLASTLTGNLTHVSGPSTSSRVPNRRVPDFHIPPEHMQPMSVQLVEESYRKVPGSSRPLKRGLSALEDASIRRVKTPKKSGFSFTLINKISRSANTEKFVQEDLENKGISGTQTINSKLPIRHQNRYLFQFTVLSEDDSVKMMEYIENQNWHRLFGSIENHNAQPFYWHHMDAKAVIKGMLLAKRHLVYGTTPTTSLNSEINSKAAILRALEDEYVIDKMQKALTAPGIAILEEIRMNCGYSAEGTNK